MKLKVTQHDGTEQELDVQAYLDLDAEAPAVESAITTEFIPLSEKAIRKNGETRIKIIQPGWGSSAYYSEAVLKRDGPKVFTKGLKSYWNHPTPTEQAERPERDIRDLAGELTSDAQYLENGPAGAGLYADMKVFKSYASAVEELAPHIGVSIRASGKAKAGLAEGRNGAVLEAITAASSVDFVTQPGAGGKVVQLFESARQGSTTEHQEEEPEMDEAKVAEMIEAATKPLKEALGTTETTLKETQTENSRLRETLLLREAQSIVEAAVTTANLLPMTRDRLIERLSTECPVKEGALDKDALAETVKTVIESEQKYLAAAGVSPVRGMGNSGAPEDYNSEESMKRREANFRSLGLSEAGAKLASADRS